MGNSGWMLRESPTLTYFASLKDIEVFLTYNTVREHHRHQNMTCGIVNDLQEMEKSVPPGFGQFLWVEAERCNNSICFFAACLACSQNSLIS